MTQKKDQDAVSGEPLPRSDQSVSTGVSVPAKRTVFGNRLQKKRIESVRELIKEQSRYMTAVEQHDRVKDRLLNLPEAMKTEREAEKRRTEIVELKDQIELAPLKKVLAQVEGEEEEDTQEEKNRRKLEAALRQGSFEAAMKVIQAKKGLQTRQALARERDRLVAKVTAKANKKGALLPEINPGYREVRKMIDEVEP